MESKLLQKPQKTWPSLFDTRRFEKLFDAPFGEMFDRTMNVPAVNVTESEKEFRLCLAVPGLDKKDFRVDADDEMLTISAEKEKEEKEEKNGRFNRREYNYSSWSRSFTLPENCDPTKIMAEYKNGELFVTIPKTKMVETPPSRHIDVK